MRVALIRHGETDWNVAGRLQGRTDNPLNGTGRRQGILAAELLEGSRPWTGVVSSPLQRATQTAEIIAAALRIRRFGSHTDLVEQEFGLAEGLPVTRQAELLSRSIELGIEPGDSVGDRGLRALEHLASVHAEEHLVAVTHGALIRRTVARVTGIPFERIPPVGNASSTVIERVDEGWLVRTFDGEDFATVFG